MTDSLSNDHQPQAPEWFCKVMQPLVIAYKAAESVMRLRGDGWMVASHNDYPKDGKIRSYWSFSRGNQFVDGDGADDREAVSACLSAASKLAERKAA